MKTQRKHTRAVRFITDELVDADAIDAAPQAEVDAYLEKNGIKVSQLDARLSKFSKSLDGRLLMAKAEAECVIAKNRVEKPIDYSHLSDEELFNLLNKRSGGQEQLGLAARTTGKLSRKDLECLLRDTEDEG